MIRLEKVKQLDRMPEDERRKMVAEIKASKTVTDLIKAVLEEKTVSMEASMVGQINSPYELAGTVKTVSILKQLTQLFEETTNDNT